MKKQKIMQIVLSNGEKDETVSLPMTQSDADKLADCLEVKNIADCKVLEFEVFNEYLAGVRFCINPNFTALNGIAKWADSMQTNDYAYSLETFAAVLEAKNIIDINDAFSVTENIDSYDFINAQTVGDYGHFVLYESAREDIDPRFAEEVEDYIDYEAYGEWRVKKDGAIKISRGYVVDNTNFRQAHDMDMRM